MVVIAVAVLDLVYFQGASHPTHAIPWHPVLASCFELCSLVPELFFSKTTNIVVELGRVLNTKWIHDKPMVSTLETELMRSIDYWNRLESLPTEVFSVWYFVTCKTC